MPINLISQDKSHLTVAASISGNAMYPPTVHLICRRKVIESEIGNEWVESDIASGWTVTFSLLTSKNVEIASESILILLGETDEIAKVNITGPRAVDELSSLLNDSSPQREWIAGLTYYDGLRLGFKDDTIVELLYLDVLRRRPDPGGLKIFLAACRIGGLDSLLS